jgi:hypothetical protein
VHPSATPALLLQRRYFVNLQSAILQGTGHLNMLACVADNGIGVGDADDLPILVANQDWLLAALNALLGAGCVSFAAPFGSALGVADPAVIRAVLGGSNGA